MKKPTEEQIAIHPEVTDMMQDLGKISSIKVLADSEGGKILVGSLVTDIVGTVDTLCARYQKLTLQEFVALSADMKSKIDLVRVITRAPKNKKSLEGLIEDTIKE